MSDWPLRDVRVNARKKKTNGKKNYIVIQGRWQICRICLDRSVLIVLTIIDRSFCRRRKKNVFTRTPVVVAEGRAWRWNR